MDVLIDAGLLWTSSHSEHISARAKESFTRSNGQVVSVFCIFFAILFHIVVKIRHFEPGEGKRAG